MQAKNKVTVIGAGFAGMSAAALLAKEGYKVTLLEKNGSPGGRAAVWEKDGFKFDLGPSWYWMPEVFEEYFSLFGKKASDFYELVRLNPSYRIYFGINDFIDIPASLKELEAIFESLEKGSALKLREFLKLAEYKYNTGMREYVHKPSLSLMEYADLRLLKEAFRIQIFRSLKKHIRKYFRNERIIKIMEFPVLFLGSTPEKSPALYSMMNYADLVLGTWYPLGGMVKVAAAMRKVAEDSGVKFRFNETAVSINTANNKAVSVQSDKALYETDLVISGCDYRHTEHSLLGKADRTYSDEYWESRVMSPSALLYFLASDVKIEGIRHHSLFFDEEFDLHASEIYGNPNWPSKPLFYLSAPSVTDPTIVPGKKELLTFLIPVASGLKDSNEKRDYYYKLILDRFSKMTGTDISRNIIHKRDYSLNDFSEDYNSFKGNAYGLANTLTQTAVFKPKMKSKKINNLLYAGQLTVPGPGVPPAIISGKIAASEGIKILKQS